MKTLTKGELARLLVKYITMTPNVPFTQRYNILLMSLERCRFDGCSQIALLKDHGWIDDCDASSCGGHD